MTQFVKDIRGEDHETYLTFREGWIYQQIIDVVRESSGWKTIAAE